MYVSRETRNRKDKRKGKGPVMEDREKLKGKGKQKMEESEERSARYKRRRQHSDGPFVSVVNEDGLKEVEKNLEKKIQKSIIEEFVKWDGSVRKSVDESMREMLREQLHQNMKDLRASMLNALRDAGKSTYLSQTPAELGADAKERADLMDNCVPQPVDEGTANHIWGRCDMWEQLSKDSKYRILEQDFNKMLNNVKWDKCSQKMSFTGYEKEELSSQKHLDYTIYVKDKAHVPSNVTALLSLFSSPDPGKKSKKGKYNGKAQVGGHAIRRATTVLNSAGPSRSKIVVGVTNLRCVQWYTVEKTSCDDEYSQGPYLYSRTPEIDETKRSLTAIFLADPAHLYCNLAKKHRVDGSTVEFVEFLGSGATSSVYKATHIGDIVATKLYKKGFFAQHEMGTLKLLGGVQGVPVFKGVATDLKLLLLSPVGKSLKKSMPTEARINLTGIIDTLKEAHHRHIVHRDVRMGNILLVDRSFMLIDWGFACKVGEMDLFQGSLLTASSKVLENHGNLIEYTPEDDLISFVKSLYLFSHERLSCQIRQLSGKDSRSGCLMLDPTKINSIWKQLLEGADAWQRALELAGKLSYDELKDWVFWWAVNFCPQKL